MQGVVNVLKTRMTDEEYLAYKRNLLKDAAEAEVNRIRRRKRCICNGIHNKQLCVKSNCCA